MDGWRKLGRLVQAPGQGLAQTHAMLPTPLLMDDRIRVFFAACDQDLRGRVFFADVERAPPHRLLLISPDPVLDVGDPDAFDADGVNPSQIVVLEDRLVLLYIGWRRGPAAEPYTLFAGLAFSEDGGLSFRKQDGPLLPPGPGERLFRTAPFVQPEGASWKMFYIAGEAFAESDGKRVPIYALCEISSPSLTAWPAAGRVMLAPDLATGEIGFGRPVIWRDASDRPTLMLSVRTRGGYQLTQAPLQAFAGSRPQLQPVLATPFEPWESQMTCFGAPCDTGERELLFYNGDGFGRSGFGLAWRPRVHPSVTR